MSATPVIQQPMVALNDGRAMPQIGFGVYTIPPGSTTRTAVEAALAAGYRHVDTAARYGNEADVGDAIRASGLSPGSVWVTTKLWNSDQGAHRARLGFERSLRQLGMDAVDLYLLHWPDPRSLESWRVLEQLRAEGLARSIGVSNFMVRHLDWLLASASVPPAVNQIEMNPFIYRTREDTVRRCVELGIAVEAWAPLSRGYRLGHPTLRAIATDTGRTPAQVLIRWSLQKGFIVIPRSTNCRHIERDLHVLDFTLDDSQVAALDALDEGLTTDWDPETMT